MEVQQDNQINDVNTKNVKTDVNKKSDSNNYTEQVKNQKVSEKSATQKVDPQIKLRNVTAKTMTNVTFIADFPKDATGNVVFKLNTRTLTKTKIKVTNGTAQYFFKIPAYSAKNYNLMLSYSGSYKYKETKVNATLTLTKLKTTVTATNPQQANQGQVSKISAKVTNELKMPVETKVAFKVNGKTLGVVMSDNSTGIATLNYTFTKAYNRDLYNITYISGENNKHQTGTLYGTIKLYKQSKVTVDPVTAKTGSKISLKATVVDINDKKISTGTVTFKVNGNNAGTANVKSGIATINYQLPKINAGNYIITATYNKNNVYAASQGSQNLVVTKIPTKITTYGMYVNAGSSNSANIALVDEKGIALSGQVTVYVNNKEYTKVNAVNGNAIFKYTAAYAKSSSQLPLKVVFNGNGIYQGSNCNSHITILSNENVYVGPNGNDNNLGNSTSPYKTIAKALSQVNNNGVIYLKEGQYKEAGLSTSKSVRIEGLADKSKVIINAVNQNKVVLSLTNSNAVVTLKKLTIGNSNIKSATNVAAVVSKGTLNVENSVFSNNIVNNKESSGAIHSTGTLVIVNSIMTNNKAYNSDGGAIRNVRGNLTVVNSSFTINLASGNGIGGAAIFTYNSNSTIINTYFDGNVGNGTNSSGGAVKVAYGNSTIESSTFNNNAIKGATQVVGGAIASLNCNLYLVNDKFTKNQAIGTDIAGGAGVYDQNSILLVYNTSLSANTVSGRTVYGGAIYNYNAYSSIVNTNLSGNILTGNSKNGKAYGGAINYRGGTLTANNVKCISNKATANDSCGGALYFIGSKLDMSSSSFTSNIAEGTSVGGAGAIFSYANAVISTTTFTANQASGPSNGGGAIANVGNMSVTKTNFINNVASAAGSAMSNGGNVITINGNYWGSSYPNWSTLLSNIKTPTSYSKTRV